MRRSWGWVFLAFALLFLVSCGGGADNTAQRSSANRLTVAKAPAQSPLAANVVDATAIFTWAQWHYSQLFAGGYESGNYTEPGSGRQFNYRYYPVTQHYLGVANGNVYVLGPQTSQNIYFAGSLASFECQVFPANCPVTGPASSNGVALAGLYYDEFGLMLIDPDGSFVGYNPVGARADLYAGTAVVLADTWSATNATFGTYIAGNTSANRGATSITATYSAASAQTVNFTVTGVTPIKTSLALSYHSQSKSAASLATVGGLYSTPSAGQSIMIDPSSGAISGTFATNCAIAGTASVSSASRNIYKIQATLTGSNCPVTSPVSYLAMYDDLGIADQALHVYGTTTGSELNFVWLNFLRSGDGI